MNNLRSENNETRHNENLIRNDDIEEGQSPEMPPNPILTTGETKSDQFVEDGGSGTASNMRFTRYDSNRTASNNTQPHARFAADTNFRAGNVSSVSHRHGNEHDIFSESGRSSSGISSFGEISSNGHDYEHESAHGTRAGKGILEYLRSIVATIETTAKSERNVMGKSWVDQNSKNATADRSLRGLGARLTAEMMGTKIIEYLAYTIFAIFLQLVLGRGYCFPDGVIHKGQATFACDASNGSSTINLAMCDLHYSNRQGVAQLRVLVAFILAGFVTNTVLMWRLRRTNYCTLCGAVRTLLIQLGSHVESGSARKTMERWTVLGYEIALLKARGVADTDSGRRHVEELGLLHPGEWEVMMPGDRHTNTWFWIQKCAVKARANDDIASDMQLIAVCDAIGSIRDKANDLMSCIDRDQPIPYTSVVASLINLNLLMISVSKGVEWAILFYETGGGIWKTPQMYAEVIVNIIYSSMFAILFDLCHKMYNPFGPRDGIDIPHDIVGAGLRQLAKEMSSNSEPPAMNEMVGLSENDDRERTTSIFLDEEVGAATEEWHDNIL